MSANAETTKKNDMQPVIVAIKSSVDPESESIGISGVD